MKLYFAPMEGITGLVCRNAYEACFSGSIEKYFAPFITATLQKDVSLKELRDIIPEKNKVPYLVPQILANRADAFIKTAEAITALGYQEINLNLGCPSKTVVTKRKGAGFLEFPHQVDDFLEEVCDWTQKNNIRFSVKTRLGMDEEDEFWTLLEIYNKYPLCELIVHPRLQSDYYIKPVHEGVFERACGISSNPLCYNGDISDEGKLREFAAQACDLEHRRAVMIGRGFLSHPGMGSDLEAELNPGRQNDNLWKFHDAVYEGYCDYIQGETNVLFKMKELWSYMGVNFDEGDPRVKKAFKQLRKSRTCADYEMAVSLLRIL